MAGHIWQSKLEAFCTDVIQALRYHPDGVIHLRPILTTAFFDPRLSQEVRPYQGA